MRKKLSAIRRGVGVHQEVGDQIQIVAGVEGQDVDRLRPVGFGTIPIPEDRSERGRQLTSHGQSSIRANFRDK